MRTVLQILIGAAAIHVLWLLAAWVMNSKVLPSPIEVYALLPSNIRASHLWMHLLASMLRLLSAMFLSIVLGLGLSIAIYFSRFVGQLLDAVVYFFYPIPKLILLPIVMLLCGLGNVSKVVMVMLVLVFQITVHLRDALRDIPQSFIDVVISLKGNRLQLLRHVLLPSIMPGLFSAIRVALGTAISVLFVTETYGTERGLGYLVVDQWMRLDYIAMYGSIVVLGFVGFLLFVLTDTVEKRFHTR